MKFIILTDIKISDAQLSELLADSHAMLFGESETPVDFHRFYVDPSFGIFIYDDMNADNADDGAVLFFFKDDTLLSEKEANVIVEYLRHYTEYAKNVFGDLYMIGSDELNEGKDEGAETDPIFSDGENAFFMRICEWKFSDIEKFKFAHSKAMPVKANNKHLH